MAKIKPYFIPNVKGGDFSADTLSGIEAGDVQAVLAGDVEKVQQLLDSPDGTEGLAVVSPGTKHALGSNGVQAGCFNVNRRVAVENSSKIQRLVTLLHIAAFAGQLQVVKLLVQSGANLQKRSLSQYIGKPVSLALQRRNEHFAAYYKSWTPLHMAASTDHVEVMDALWTASQGHADGPNLVDCRTHTTLAPLHLAAGLGHARATRWLLQKGASAEEMTQDSYTALHYAANSGFADVCSILLRAGASVNKKTVERKSPLHLAILKKGAGCKEVAQLLVEHGAELNAFDDEGTTPLHLSMVVGDATLVQLLLQRGADPCAPQNDGKKPINYAVGNGHIAAVRLLLDYGAGSLEEQETPRFIKAFLNSFKDGQETISLALLRHGCNPNQSERKNGNTPLHYASMRGELRVVERLRNAGAQLVLNKEGKSPQILAKAMGFDEVATFLLQNDGVVERTSQAVAPSSTTLTDTTPGKAQPAQESAHAKKTPGISPLGKRKGETNVHRSPAPSSPKSRKGIENVAARQQLTPSRKIGNCDADGLKHHLKAFSEKLFGFRISCVSTRKPRDGPAKMLPEGSSS